MIYVAIGLPIISILFLLFLLDYLSHLGQIDEYTKKWAWGSYKDFKIQFFSHEWIRKPRWEQSYFSAEDSDNYCIHANIIQFNGIGMMLYPWSFIAYKWFCHNDRLGKLSSKKIKTNW